MQPTLLHGLCDLEAGVSVTPALDSGAFRENGTGQRWGSELGEVVVVEKKKRSESLGNLLKYVEGEQVVAGWPAWLSAVAGETIHYWVLLVSKG
ncbi:hypothetical protein RHGRI_030876 [Rhododendron griersonianum]|uniref:Uncharacterized protein n=1 Tax=Rhododendron griersonianum TaxID=479676 RepID=A0AAV6I6G7_9ERIC|nr:hypothetical protein RHGRI_030876 [Rhododendron griersonianum]